jgi:sulfite reductase (NADPH) hemoprotein beta-component
VDEASGNAIERIKRESRYLRGQIAESLADPVTAGVPEASRQLLKFHGTYLQDDRDVRAERDRQRLEPAYQFMIRVRVPGGCLTAEQWLHLDAVAERYAGGQLRLTSRQAVQLHGVLKWDLRPTIAAINEVWLTTLGACGDVNRNVMAPVNPLRSPAHRDAHALADALSRRLAPRTGAYAELWIGGQPADREADEEPLYGAAYLPRKFKIAIAVPPVNDVDVFAQDLGFIAEVDAAGQAVGYTVVVGGGMGFTYGDRSTYPQLARPLAFVAPDQVVAVAEAVVAIQRDFGDRTARHHARFKYTVDRLGLDGVKAELTRRLGWTPDPPRPVAFRRVGDVFGWEEGPDGRLHWTLFVPEGRVRDGPRGRLRTGLRALVAAHGGAVILTPRQNLVLAGIAPEARPELERIARAHGLPVVPTPIEAEAMACVGLPTCGLAMAESERYLPALVKRVEAVWNAAGLAGEPLDLRLTGCPNGCARPYLAEVGLTGRAPGRYDVYLGGNRVGTRLAAPWLENLAEPDVVDRLAAVIRHYARARRTGERFGDFVVRAGYVPAVTDGRHFHAPKTLPDDPMTDLGERGGTT